MRLSYLDTVRDTRSRLKITEGAAHESTSCKEGHPKDGGPPGRSNTRQRLSAAGASPVAAAACWGPSCNGLNPQGRCDGDARTISGRTAWSGQYIELRYSPSCGAAWVRWAPRGTSGPYAVPSVWNPGGRSYGVTAWNGYFHWTAMVDGRVGIEDCYGAQNYQSGRWIKWEFYGCVR